MMAEKPQEKGEEGKKRKQQKGEEEENDNKEANREAPKKMKEAKAAAAATKGGKGEKAAGGAGAQFELGNKRMVTVDTFGGKPRVDLREYYLKDREDENSLAPGKKGISLTVEQWRKLWQLGAQIDAVLEKCL